MLVDGFAKVSRCEEGSTWIGSLTDSIFLKFQA